MRISDWSSDVCSSDLGRARSSLRTAPRSSPSFPRKREPSDLRRGLESKAKTPGSRFRGNDDPGGERRSKTGRSQHISRTSLPRILPQNEISLTLPRRVVAVVHGRACEVARVGVPVEEGGVDG